MNTTSIKFLLKLKNASLIFQEKVEIEYNMFNLSILKVLYRTGCIQYYSINTTKTILIVLKKDFNKSLTQNLKIISTPTNKVVLDYKDISQLKRKNNTTMIFSTNNGLLTLTECKKQKLGGLLLFIC